MKKALIISNAASFLLKFECDNVNILQSKGYEVHYAANFLEAGYDFDFDDFKKTGVITHQVSIARSPYMYRMNRQALCQIKKIIAEEGIQLIHCHTPVGGLLGRLAGIKWFNKMKRPVVIYTAHGFHFYKGAPLFNNLVYKAVERILARLTDVLITINTEDFRYAANMHLRRKGKAYLIPGTGFSPSKFAPVPDSEKISLRKKLGIDPSAFFLLSVGEITENKNHKCIIQAIQILKNLHKADDIYYGICGHGYYYNKMENYIKRLGLDKNIKLFGFQKNIADFYGAADATVFPSVREGLGMAGIESLAMGVPVIASDNRGTREYMEDGVNGFVYPCYDVNGFAEGILKLKKMPEAERDIMRKKCWDSVQKFRVKNSHRIMDYIYSMIDQEIRDYETS